MMTNCAYLFLGMMGMFILMCFAGFLVILLGVLVVVILAIISLV